MDNITFIPDPKHPKDSLNTVPLYAVQWDRTGHKRLKRTGNAWYNRAEAEAVYREKLAAGLNPTASVSYCAAVLSF